MNRPLFPESNFLCVVSAAHDAIFRLAPALGSAGEQVFLSGRVGAVVAQVQWPVEHAVEAE